MSKFTLTINTDEISDLVQFLTPSLVAAVVGSAAVSSTTTLSAADTITVEKVSAPTETPVVATLEPTTPKKRGRKPKNAAETVLIEEEFETPIETPVKAEAEAKATVEVPTPETNAPTEATDEDFGDVLEASAKITQQQLTDAAVDVGSKHGRDTMIAGFALFSPSGKLAGVAEKDYAKLHGIFLKLRSLENKAAAKAYLESLK